MDFGLGFGTGPGLDNIWTKGSLVKSFKEGGFKEGLTNIRDALEKIWFDHQQNAFTYAMIKLIICHWGKRLDFSHVSSNVSRLP